MALRTVTATRYVTPLREGGSLPAIVEADDDGTYVLKFRGAGQGHRALVAELVAGEIGRLLGLDVPEIVLMELDPALGRSEPDPEIQDLLQGSAGLNLALDYLPGSITFDPLVPDTVQYDRVLASRIAWFDAFVTNVDRTARNTNMLVWHKRLWLIDHGASLYFHHDWDGYRERINSPFPAIKDHVLLPFAEQIDAVDEEMARTLTPDALRQVIDLIPDEWLGDAFADVEEHREAYMTYLTERLTSPRAFVKEAANAHRHL